jgi:hypothetical protein
MTDLINVKKIYDLIPDYIKSHGTGFIAGSWVAAEIFKQLNLDINPVANDIDWFLHFEEKNTEELYGVSMNKFPFNSVRTMSFGHNNIGSDQYGNLVNSYIPDYKVITSKRIDDYVNAIAINFSTVIERYIPELNKLVNNFDINAIQVGIDVELKTLYGTEAFWNFCKSKQLEIINFYTPAHSIIRYLKKKRELSCYGDNDFNAKVVISTLSNFGYVSSNKFGKETYIKALIESDELTKLGFEIKAMDVDEGIYQSFYLAHKKESEIITSIYQVFGKDVLFNEEKMRVNILQTESEEYNHFHSIHPRNIWKVANLALRGSVSEKIFFESFFQNLNVNEAYVQYNLASLLIGQKIRNNNVFKKYSRIGKESNNLLDYAGSISKGTDDVVLIENFLKAVKKEISHAAIGVIEQSSFARSERMPTYEELKVGDYTRTFSEINTVLNMYKADLTEPLETKYIDSNIIVKELTTQEELMMEGKQQNHCVGGYASGVKEGRLRIIQVRTKDKSNPQITFEIRQTDQYETITKKCWKVIQAQLKSNHSPSQEWRDEAIDAINKTFVNDVIIVLPFSFKYSW